MSFLIIVVVWSYSSESTCPLYISPQMTGGADPTGGLSANVVKNNRTPNQLLSFLMCHRFYSLLSHETASQYYSAPRHHGHSSEAPAMTDGQTARESRG